MKKFIKYLFVTPIAFATIIPVSSCGCSSQEESKDVVPEDKLSIKNGVLSGFVDGFNPKEYKSLVIPNTVTTISASAFSGNFSGDDCLLTTIKIAPSVKTIETKAFYGNSAIKTYNLADFTSADGYSWESDAFAESNSTGEIVYPWSGNTETVNNQVDYLLCDAGLAIGWFDTTKERAVEDKFFDESKDPFVLKGFKESFYTTKHTALFNKLVVPSKYTAINANAFFDGENSTLSNITRLVFETDAETSLTNVTIIGENAFRKSNLNSIELKSGTSTIRKAAFKDCCAFESITLPDTLVTINDNAFENCNKLKELTLPQTLVNLGDSAFKNCSSLSKINLMGIYSVLSSWNNNAFMGIASAGKISCEPPIAQSWKAYFLGSSILFDKNNWSITDKNNILDGYESLVKPYPISGLLTKSEIQTTYFSAMESNSQILIDDLYHSFYEWTKTASEQFVTLTQFDALISNASVRSIDKTVTFSLYYEIAGKVNEGDIPFNAQGNITFISLPLNVDEASNIGEERKYLKLVDKTYSSSTRWYISLQETYNYNSIAGTIPSDPTKQFEELDHDSLQEQEVKEMKLDRVGLFLNLNKFIQYDDPTWSWGMLSSYLQNITVKAE